ncbi:hypothetical protein AB0K09_04630 [Streptomyces sp. NPDC049577]|uniref:hypothetical protein n=1 Tax=Streptomyces sp. NPDC049577 TaxID=3155153 RepID=UPI0034399ED2
MTSTTRDTTPITFSGDGVEMRTQELGGGMTVLYVRADRGMDLGPALKGLPDDLCQCPHWGFLAEGRVRLRTAAGEEMYEAGETFYWAPGHAPEALEDSAFLIFSPTDQLGAVMTHMREQTG